MSVMKMFTAVVVAALFCAGCNKDDNPEMFTTLCTLIKDPDQVLFRLDDKTYMAPYNSDAVKTSVANNQTGERMMVSYTVKKEATQANKVPSVEIYMLSNVLMPDVADTFDPAKEAKIDMTGVMASGGFINVNFFVRVGSPDFSKTHRICLVKADQGYAPDAPVLELRHAILDDPYDNYEINSLLCTPIEGLFSQTSLDELDVTVRCTHVYDGEPQQAVLHLKREDIFRP